MTFFCHPLAKSGEKLYYKSGDKLHIGGRKWVIIMFMGQYEHTIDTKGRIIIPAKYRNELGDTFVITKGLDGCLFIYPSQEWIDFADKLMGLSSRIQEDYSVSFYQRLWKLQLINREGYLFPDC